jgi:hypothetical protein
MLSYLLCVASMLGNKGEQDESLAKSVPDNARDS